MRCRMIAVVAVLGLIAAAAPCQAQSLNGSGSSFVGPMMSKWARDYKKAKEIEINYTTVGSGRGIAQITSQDVDFACTDAPMTDEQVQKAKDELMAASEGLNRGANRSEAPIRISTSSAADGEAFFLHPVERLWGLGERGRSRAPDDCQCQDQREAAGLVLLPSRSRGPGIAWVSGLRA